ncbi:MAG: hypothetical protein ACYCQI_14975 [Gammaproteobacteria bacterium]
MQNRKPKKTCLSVVLNFLSSCKPANLFIGYLALSSMVLGRVAAEQAQPTMFLRKSDTGIRFFGDESLCIKPVAKECILTLSALDHETRSAVELAQVCDPNKIREITAKPLREQAVQNKFFGNLFCNGILTGEVVEGNGDKKTYHLDFASDSRTFKARIY